MQKEIKEMRMYSLTIKKSRFYGFIYPINKIETLDKLIDELKSEYKKATHYIYVYKIGTNVKVNNDKEIVGAGGDTTLSLMDKNNLNNYLIVIIRYFGGVKLGIGPLIRTYNAIVKELIKDNIKTSD